jgi:hypothetical protein
VGFSSTSTGVWGSSTGVSSSGFLLQQPIYFLVLVEEMRSGFNWYFNWDKS